MIIHQLILLFGLIILGYTINKAKILDAVANEKISKLLVNVAIPATIIHSSISQQSGSGQNVLCVFVIAIGFFVVIPVLSYYASKFMKKGGTYELMLTYSNLGFMGIPIVSSGYGQEYVFYVTIFMMVFNISIFSQGIFILSRDCKDGSKGFHIRHLINPGIISAVIGLLLFLFKIPIPGDVDSLFDKVGTITTPLAMIVIGSSLAEIPLKKVLTDYTMYILAVIKLFIYPLIVLGILQFFIKDTVILGISVILTSLPTAGNVSMVCSEYGGDIESVSKGICITTVLSILSIPFWLYVLG